MIIEHADCLNFVFQFLSFMYTNSINNSEKRRTKEEKIYLNFQIKILVNSQFFSNKFPIFLLKFIISQSLVTWTRRLLTILRSSRGDSILFYSNQWEYRVSKKKPNKTYYQSIQRKNNSCPAGAVVKNENDKIISFLGEHTHDSDLLKKRVREIEKQVVKESSGNIAISPRTVLGNIYNIGLQRYRD